MHKTNNPDPNTGSKHLLFYAGAGGLAVLLFMTTAGCSGIRMALPQTDATTQRSMNALFNAPLAPSRRTIPDERFDVVVRVDEKGNSAAVRVCRRAFANPQSCAGLIQNRTMTVFYDDEGINAFVGGNYDLTVLGGLISAAGTDDEIAMVLAHEYSHALMGHVARTGSNTFDFDNVKGTHQTGL